MPTKGRRLPNFFLSSSLPKIFREQAGFHVHKFSLSHTSIAFVFLGLLRWSNSWASPTQSNSVPELFLLNADSIAPVMKGNDIQSTCHLVGLLLSVLSLLLKRCVLRHAYKSFFSQRVTLPLASGSNGYGLDGWSLPYWSGQGKQLLSNRLIGDTWFLFE